MRLIKEEKEALAAEATDEDDPQALSLPLDLKASLKGKLLQAKSILEKRGWTTGRGLGAEQEGILESIAVKAQFNKAGLGCENIGIYEEEASRYAFLSYDETTVGASCVFRHYC